MQKLLFSSKKGSVDLYYNDAFGLKNALNNIFSYSSTTSYKNQRLENAFDW